MARRGLAAVLIRFLQPQESLSPLIQGRNHKISFVVGNLSDFGFLGKPPTFVAVRPRFNRQRDTIFWMVVFLVPREVKQSKAISGQNLWCHGEVHGLFWSGDCGMVSLRKMIQYELDDRR